jgi:ribosomal protein S18 acetylase RimI-like enzyme
MTITIRRLVADDTDACIALRQAMLHDAPAAFLASPEADFGSDPARVRTQLSDSGPESVIFGVFDGAFDGVLVGSVGMMRSRHAKAAHKVDVWGMYVAPAARRQGLGRRLLDAVIEHAQGMADVRQINLGVSADAPAARALYEALGFQAWGTEPNALGHGGRLFDETHMVLTLPVG